MSKITEYYLSFEGRSTTLPEFVRFFEYKTYHDFPAEKQVTVAMRLSKIEDKELREQAIELLAQAGLMQRRLDEIKEMGKQLSTVINKIVEAEKEAEKK